MSTSGTQDLLTLYEIVKDVFSASFILITSIIAYRGLNIWKKEQILKGKREISIKLLTELGNAVNEINRIRQSDLIFNQEILDAISVLNLVSLEELPENKQYAAVLTNRWNNLKTYFQIITILKIQAKIIFGHEIEIDNVFSNFEETIAKIGNAMQKIVTLYSSDRKITINDEEYQSNQEIVYSSWNINKNGVDLISIELEEGYKKIADNLNPFIKFAND